MSTLSTKAQFYDAIFTRIQKGVESYNYAIDSADSNSPFKRLQKVGDANVIDDRTAAGRQRFKLIQQGGTVPNAFPLIMLSHTGGSEQKTVTPTFGLASGSDCDAIIPKTVSLLMVIRYDMSAIGDSIQIPLEDAIDCAFHQQGDYPKYGMLYCRGVTWPNDTRRPEKFNKAEVTVFRQTIRGEFVQHLLAV